MMKQTAAILDDYRERGGIALNHCTARMVRHWVDSGYLNPAQFNGRYYWSEAEEVKLRILNYLWRTLDHDFLYLMFDHVSYLMADTEGTRGK